MRYKPLYPPKRHKLVTLHMDGLLLLGIIVLCALGLVTLYSAQQSIPILERQMIRLVVAFAAMILVAQMPPRLLKAMTPWLYGATLLLLFIVLFIGHIGKGGQRWLDLWFFRFQPAEIMKIAVPMMVARSLHDQRLPPRLKNLIMPFFFIMIPVILTAKQPDLGTAILILSSGFFVIFFAGLSWRLLCVGAGLSIAALPMLWLVMLDYQKERVLVFLDPTRDPLGKGYHIIQSKIAIGSGGLYGKGWLNGSQSQLEFLPERTTDSIFAVFSEEFGLVGCLLMLTVYLCIIARGLYMSTQAQETFSRLLAGSVIMTLFVYVLVNIGMVSGLCPAVGIPLPLVSYGGTSMVTLMVGFGILISIHTHRTLLQR